MYTDHGGSVCRFATHYAQGTGKPGRRRSSGQSTASRLTAGTHARSSTQATAVTRCRPSTGARRCCLVRGCDAYRAADPCRGQTTAQLYCATAASTCGATHYRDVAAHATGCPAADVTPTALRSVRIQHRLGATAASEESNVTASCGVRTPSSRAHRDRSCAAECSRATRYLNAATWPARPRDTCGDPQRSTGAAAGRRNGDIATASCKLTAARTNSQRASASTRTGASSHRHVTSRCHSTIPSRY